MCILKISCHSMYLYRNILVIVRRRPHISCIRRLNHPQLFYFFFNFLQCMHVQLLAISLQHMSGWYRQPRVTEFNYFLKIGVANQRQGTLLWSYPLGQFPAKCSLLNAIFTVMCNPKLFYWGRGYLRQLSVVLSYSMLAKVVYHVTSRGIMPWNKCYYTLHFANLTCSNSWSPQVSSHVIPYPWFLPIVGLLIF